LFRGVHGRLELDLSERDKARAGTVLPAFCSRGGEEVGIPRRFRSAVRAVTAAVHCTGCSHSHFTKLPNKGRGTQFTSGIGKHSESCRGRLTRVIQEGELFCEKS
jgi:hypothetical protein